jgi:hypothetical protein
MKRRKSSVSRVSDSDSSTVVEELTPTSDEPLGVLGKELDRFAPDIDGGDQNVADKLEAMTRVSPPTETLKATPPPKCANPGIALTHVDLMYIPTNGKLVCRACL